MMKLYRVEGGPASFGPGSLLALDDAQLAARAAYVEVVEAPGEGQRSPAGRHVVRVATMQQFKTGEIIGFETPAPKYLLERLVPLNGEGGEELREATAKPAQSRRGR